MVIKAEEGRGSLCLWKRPWTTAQTAKGRTQEQVTAELHGAARRGQREEAPIYQASKPGTYSECEKELLQVFQQKLGWISNNKSQQLIFTVC